MDARKTKAGVDVNPRRPFAVCARRTVVRLEYQ